MFEKIDAFMDRAMDKKWVQVLVFTALILNAIMAIVGAILIAVMLG